MSNNVKFFKESLGNSMEELDINNQKSNNIIEDEFNVPEIQDGGWGWVVLAAALFIRIVMVGVYASFALFTKDFTAEYDMSPSIMSWMISMYSSISLLVAPIGSFLGEKYNYRRVSIISLTVAGFVYPSTYFYPALWYTFLTASIIVPFLHGLANICVNIILSFYFDKYLPIALGVFASGNGFASFIITPLMAVIINNFGWKLSKPIYSLLYVLAVLAALTFRKVKAKKTDNKMKAGYEVSKADDLSYVFISRNSRIIRFLSLPNVATIFHKNKENKRVFISLENIFSNKKERKNRDFDSKDMTGSQLVVINSLSKMQIGKIVDNNESSRDNVTKTKRYCELLSKPVFILFLVSNLFSCLGYDTSYVYAKDRALELGVSESQATSILTCLGIGNIIGRVAFGFIGAKKGINRFITYIISSITAGLFILMSKVAFSYPFMVTYAIGFGIFIGGIITLGQVLLLHLLKISDFSHALSIMCIVQAVGLLAGAPISGFIFDATKSFEWPFVYCGIIIILSGLVLTFAYLSKEFRKSGKCN
uniref:Slc16a-4 n=1 Tax=Schmidtea mediterranea TaxID=79327 RepID=A0A0H3YJ42_SCHMD|nr:slc16a-4 [Schmidtea mediterranea]